MRFPERSYLICGNQRTGSTMLARALADTGVAGRPEEYFLAVPQEQFPELACWEDSRPECPSMTSTEYLQWAYDHGTTNNGVFGAKMLWNTVVYAVEKFRGVDGFAGRSTAAVFERAFPRLEAVMLTRRDRVAQAVSWARADQEGVWVVSASEPAEPTGAPHYDEEFIGNLVGLIETGETWWRRFLAGRGVVPLEVTYEDLIADPTAIVAQITDHLDLDWSPTSIVARTERQADELNEEWIARFRQSRSAWAGG